MDSEEIVAVTEGPPSMARALEGLATPSCGAVALLATLARDVPLEVELQPEARATLARTASAVIRGDVLNARIAHAQGRVPPGEPIAIAAVAAVHRADALRAARQLLNGLKGVARRRET